MTKDAKVVLIDSRWWGFYPNREGQASITSIGKLQSADRELEELMRTDGLLGADETLMVEYEVPESVIADLDESRRRFMQAWMLENEANALRITAIKNLSEMGISQVDIALLLGISQPRVQQLLRANYRNSVAPSAGVAAERRQQWGNGLLKLDEEIG